MVTAAERSLERRAVAQASGLYMHFTVTADSHSPHKDSLPAQLCPSPSSSSYRASLPAAPQKHNSGLTPTRCTSQVNCCPDASSDATAPALKASASTALTPEATACRRALTDAFNALRSALRSATTSGAAYSSSRAHREKGSAGKDLRGLAS